MITYKRLTIHINKPHDVHRSSIHVGAPGIWRNHAGNSPISTIWRSAKLGDEARAWMANVLVFTLRDNFEALIDAAGHATHTWENVFGPTLTTTPTLVSGTHVTPLNYQADFLGQLLPRP